MMPMRKIHFLYRCLKFIRIICQIILEQNYIQTPKTMVQNIDKQVAEWHENNEPAKIIELLESLPQSALTHEAHGWLARSYNNLASNEENPEHYETAIPCAREHARRRE